MLCAAGAPVDRVAEQQQADHQQHARKRRERAVPPAVEVGRRNRRQYVEAQDHPLGGNHLVQEQGDRKQRQDDPQLFVDALQGAGQVQSFHGVRLHSGPLRATIRMKTEQLLFRLQRTTAFVGKGLKFSALTVGVSGGESVSVCRAGTRSTVFFSRPLTF